MRNESLQKIVKSEEEDNLRELVFAKLEATWQEIEFFKRISAMPAAERDHLILWWVACFTAELFDGVDAAAKEKFLETMKSAFERVHDEDEDEDEDEEDEDEEEDDEDK